MSYLKDRPKVSVVVPIYGVEKYLNQCVDSILAQTLKEIEIILVDDGSKDKCPQIVDEYARKDERVVAIHQENGGYGKAVNHGISVAKGEFIGIIESDDWIEPDMYEKLYNKAVLTNSDITKCGFYVYNSKKDPCDVKYEHDNVHHNINNFPDSCFTIEECPLFLIFHASIWSNLYRADFIKGQKVIESQSASYQDFPFIVEAICRAKKISVVKEYLHHYRMESGMNSSTIRRDKRLLMMPKQCIEAKAILKKYGKYELLKEEFFYHCFIACFAFYINIYWKYKYRFTKLLQELFVELSQDNSFSFKYFDEYEKNAIKHQIKGNLLRGLGINLKDIRKFIIRLHIRKSGFLVQFMGMQITNEDGQTYPKPLKKFKI